MALVPFRESAAEADVPLRKGSQLHDAQSYRGPHRGRREPTGVKERLAIVSRIEFINRAERPAGKTGSELV